MIYEPRRINWVAHPGPQSLLFSCPADILLYGGAKGGGKTDGMIVWGAIPFRVPGYRAIIFRRTFPELEHNIIPRSHELLSGVGRYDSKNHRWMFKAADGSDTFLQFAYLEREYDVYKYQGSQWARIGFDESTLFSEQQIRWMITCLRSNATSVSRQLLLASNPVGPGYGWHKLMFIRDRKNRIIYDDAKWPSDNQIVGMSTCFIQARVYDNPTLLKNDPGYITRLQTQSGPIANALLEGSWEETINLALEIFPDVHYINAFVPPDKTPKWIGIDWGKDDSAAAVWQTAMNGRVICYRDLVKPGRVIVPFAQEILALSQTEKIEYVVLSHECFSERGMGHTMADQFVEIFAKAGIPVLKSDKDHSGRLLLLREFLRTTETPLPIPHGISDYEYWLEEFQKRGSSAWKDYSRLQNRGREEVLPKMQIMRPGVFNGFSYGCSDLITSLPLLVTDIQETRRLSDNQNDHGFDACTYALKAYIETPEQTIEEAYRDQIGGKMPDSTMGATFAMQEAIRKQEEPDETDLNAADAPALWPSAKFRYPTDEELL